MRHATILMASFVLATGTAGYAAGTGDPARDEILAGYAAAATAEDPAFAGFSPGRGEALYLGSHIGGRGEANACAACHTADPRQPGRHVKTGRVIEPMAVSANPVRFTDARDVEKRFSRDCPNVLGRPCTAAEKGDFITFLAGR